MKQNTNFTNRLAKIAELEALIKAYPQSKHTQARQEGVQLLKKL
jgi:hypothetical protein